jgi:hypothetical protein
MAVKGDGYFYYTVANQPERTREAVSVAIGSSLIMGLGVMLIREVNPAIWALAGLGWAAFVLGIGTWYVVAVGRRIGGRARYDQMARALGFAMAPQALGFFPFANFVPGFLIGAVWATVCAVIAVREVHQIPTQLAIGLVIVPILLVVGALPLVALSLQSAS